MHTTDTGLDFDLVSIRGIVDIDSSAQEKWKKESENLKYKKVILISEMLSFSLITANVYASYANILFLLHEWC